MTWSKLCETTFVPSAYAADSSVAVPALVAAHVAHMPAFEAVLARRPAITGHALFETYSTLTRMPVAYRVPPNTASQLLATNFPEASAIDASIAFDALDEMSRADIVGGAVYDGLVGIAARTNDQVLLTRDRRAVRTYQALGVHFELVG